jgi:hypothetical protein
MSTTGIGAITSDGRWFVTSRNASYLPTPLFETRQILQRVDYHFGEDDPLLYPQPYLQERCHWSVIPRKPTDVNDVRSKWWSTLGTKDFQEIPGNVAGLGRWKDEALGIYKEDYLSLIARVNNHWNARQKLGKSPNLVVTVLRGQIESVLSFLRHTPLPFRRAQELLCCFQRWYLELTAAIDWCDVFRPFMDGLQKEPPKSSVERVGAFTVKILDQMFLHRAGIPVWHIHSKAEKDSVTSMYRSAPLTTPAEMEIEQKVLDGARCIYKGGSNDVAKASALENYLRDLTSPPNPFAAVDAPETTTSDQPLSLPARPGKRSTGHRFEPCKCFTR